MGYDTTTPWAGVAGIQGPPAARSWLKGFRLILTLEIARVKTYAQALSLLPWTTRVKLFFLNLYITAEAYLAPKRSWERAKREIGKKP